MEHAHTHLFSCNNTHTYTQFAVHQKRYRSSPLPCSSVSVAGTTLFGEGGVCSCAVNCVCVCECGVTHHTGGQGGERRNASPTALPCRLHGACASSPTLTALRSVFSFQSHPPHLHDCTGLATRVVLVTRSECWVLLVLLHLLESSTKHIRNSRHGIRIHSRSAAIVAALRQK